MLQEALPHMRAARKGQVIIVTSLVGFQGFPFTDAYTASKFALEGGPPQIALTESWVEFHSRTVPFTDAQQIFKTCSGG